MSYLIQKRFFDRDMVHVEIIHGDITSDLEVNKSNIVAKIGNTIKSYANAYHFKQDDFKEVIHLVDTVLNLFKTNPQIRPPF